MKNSYYDNRRIFDIDCRMLIVKRGEQMGIILILIGVTFLILVFRSYNKRKEDKGLTDSEESIEYVNNEISSNIPKSYMIQEAPKKKVNKEISIKVAGVTKSSEDGKDIQAILKSIANQYKREEELQSFDGLTNKEIIEDYYDNIGEFEGQNIYNKINFVEDELNEYDKNAIKIYLLDVNDKEHHIGYVKRDSNVALKKELAQNNLLKTETEFTGGKYKRIEYDYDYEKDKDKNTVESYEITRGLSIKIVFENEVS